MASLVSVSKLHPTFERECIAKDALFVYTTPHAMYEANSGRSISFGDLLRRTEPLYITGHSRLYDMLLELYGTRDIYICSPRFWDYRPLSVVLRHLPYYRAAAINGGFRKMTDEDLMLMRTRTYLEQGISDFPDAIYDYAASHPLVRRMCFLQDLTPISVWLIMSWIIDPRWFCQQRISPKQLESYFFLAPHQKEMRWTRPRFLCLYHSWYRPDVLDRIRYLEDETDYGTLDSPRNYLYRRWCDRFTRTWSMTQAVTYTASIVLAWVFYQWMDEVNASLKGWFFNPAVFFAGHKDAEEEYRTWLSRCAS